MMNVLPFAGRIQDQSKSLFSAKCHFQHFKSSNGLHVWQNWKINVHFCIAYSLQLLVTVITVTQISVVQIIFQVCACVLPSYLRSGTERCLVYRHTSHLHSSIEYKKRYVIQNERLQKLILVFWSACVHCIIHVHMHVHVHVGLHSASSACTMCTCTCRFTLICTIYICTCICRFTLV